MKTKLAVGASLVALMTAMVILSLNHSPRTAHHVSSAAVADPNSSFAAIMTMLAIVGCIVLYFLPGIVAQQRNHHQRAAIWVLNIFLGWTFLGWIIALMWDSTAIKQEIAVRVQQS